MNPDSFKEEKMKNVVIEAKQKVEAAVQREKNKLLGGASPSTSAPGTSRVLIQQVEQDGVTYNQYSDGSYEPAR